MENDKKKKWIERGVIAVLCLGIGMGIGWQIADHKNQEAVLTAQWEAEIFNNDAPISGNDASVMDETPEVIVYVVGCVEKPGVVHLKEGARVYEAVEQAIPLPEANVDTLPMARDLVDGETITVPDRNDVNENGETMTAGENNEGNTSASGKININTASAQELAAALPGIGDKLALSIVNYRELNGEFATEHDICNVSGVGESIYAKIVNLITVK